MTKDRRIDSFANAFLGNAELSFEERVGLGIIEQAKYTEISFEDYVLPNVSFEPREFGTRFFFAAGVKVEPHKYDALIKKYPDEADALRENRDKMNSYLEGEFYYPSTDKSIPLGCAGAGWGGGWGGHANPAFDRIINLGTDGIREIIAEGRRNNPDKESFYKGCEYALDAIDILGDRFLALAKEKYAEC